jgi:hypothetical protein
MIEAHVITCRVGKELAIVSIVLAVGIMLLAVMVVDWGAVARYIFFCLIFAIVIKPIGLMIGTGLNRMFK